MASGHQGSRYAIPVRKFMDVERVRNRHKIIMPRFAAHVCDFQSRQGKATGSEGENPLQQAVKDAQAALQDKITALENEIQDRTGCRTENAG
jgi:hypothetical protein